MSPLSVLRRTVSHRRLPLAQVTKKRGPCSTDIVRYLAVADTNKVMNRPTQIEQCMQLDHRPGGAKRCAGRQRQVKIDRGRIQRMDRRTHQDFEFGINPIVGIQWTGDLHFGIGQRIARDRLAAISQAIEMFPVCRLRNPFYFASSTMRIVAVSTSLATCASTGSLDNAVSIATGLISPIMVLPPCV